MKVKVLYFSSIRDRVKKREELLEIPDDATVSYLTGILKQLYPGISEVIDRVMIAVNEEYVNAETKLKEGDIIAIIPPVSGG
ncbi:MAG: molybdopterin converting factor subunit 1 [Persephonella sp.]|nr:molybdopterin converting factor subunit 1 [Persephonella sp.]